MTIRHFLRFAITAVLLLSGCSPQRPKPTLIVYHAAVFEPVVRDLYPSAARELSLTIRAETGSSGHLIRRHVELGRRCDLLLSADPSFFRSLGQGRFPWYLVWLADEMVLAVGVRAPHPDWAERDWVAALRAPGIRLGRADEKISPAGQYTLRIWERMERRGYPGLSAELRQKTSLVADDIGTLAARLKTGDLDYAFLFRSAAYMHEIRFIALDPDINFSKESSDGAPSIRLAASIPTDAAQPQAAEALLRWLIRPERQEWNDRGFRSLPPLFFGSRADYARFADMAEYGGEP